MSSLSPLTTAPTPPRPTHSRLRSTTISSLNGMSPPTPVPPPPASTSSAQESSPTVRLTCWAHKDADKLPLVVLNPRAFPYAKDGDIIRIRQLDAPSAAGPAGEGRKSKRVKDGGMLFKYGEADIAKIDNPRLKVRAWLRCSLGCRRLTLLSACAALDSRERGIRIRLQGRHGDAAARRGASSF